MSHPMGDSHFDVRDLHPDDLVLRNYELCKLDPWYFLENCVYTKDQVDIRNPIKQFPSHRPYLKLLVRIWQQYYKLAVPKSRRMTVSWTGIGLTLWDTIFHRVRDNALVSKEEAAAGELVKRAHFIYENIPKNIIPPELLPRIKNGQPQVEPPRMEFPDIHSQIQGWANVPHKLRQYTFSNIMGDEFAFWPQCEKFYSACEPTTEGGGRMFLITTPAPGFARRLIFDNMDEKSQVFMQPEQLGYKVMRPMEGVRVWINEQNLFCIVEIHYTADEEKRSKAFKETLKAKLPYREYMQEYELVWDSYEGMPVYGDFNPAVHLTGEALHADPDLPLLLGWDFGLHPACVVTQYVNGQLRVLKEYCATGEGLGTFSPRVMADIRQQFPRHWDMDRHYINFIDPQGVWGRDDNIDMRTCAKEMGKHGWKNIKPGAQNWEARRGSVDKLLIRMTRYGPGIVMNEVQAPILVKGFRGGYMYPESTIEIEPTQLRPKKNTFSHPHDALQYIAWGIFNVIESSTAAIEIPSPSYNPNSRGGVGEANGGLILPGEAGHPWRYSNYGR